VSQYLETPFYGSRQMTVILRQQGYEVNRKRVQRLIRQLGIEALYPKPRLSKAQFSELRDPSKLSSYLGPLQFFE